MKDAVFLSNLVLLSGLGAWVSLAAINNIRGFADGRLHIGSIMKMDNLDPDGTSRNPILARRISSEGLHVAGLLVIILCEVLVAGLFWLAVGLQLSATAGMAMQLDPVVWSNLALTGFMALAFLLLIGGTWFAYYVFMETSQLTHFVMIGLSLIGLIFLNLPLV